MVVVPTDIAHGQHPIAMARVPSPWHGLGAANQRTNWASLPHDDALGQKRLCSDQLGPAPLLVQVGAW